MFRKPKKLYMITCSVLLIALGVVLIIGIANFVLGTSAKKVRISTEKMRLGDEEYQSTNFSQFNASVWMDSYQQQLYFCPHTHNSTSRSMYDGWLCTFQDQQVVKLHKLGSRSVIIGQADGLVYYVDYGSGVYAKDVLYCYDLTQRKVSELYTATFETCNKMLLSEEGVLMIPFYPEETDETPKYLCISNENNIAVSDTAEGYCLNGRSYTVGGGRFDEDRILVSDGSGNIEELSLKLAESRALIPMSDGLLVHNRGYETMLYHLDDSGTLSVLFELPCLGSSSAVAAVGNNAFLSVKRYEKFGSFGMLRFENDTSEGTYRIDPENDTVTKISDGIYNGIYYFGGKHLYACDEYCNIYLLDFDGNVVDTVFEVLQ